MFTLCRTCQFIQIFNPKKCQDNTVCISKVTRKGRERDI
uniref:Uncharacterized protein n=1 Tax=Arundo donax TaxID=35708 RepID=A0A0A8ZAE9_ARUDO